MDRGRFGTPWFVRHTYGWGYRPSTWEGWGLTLLFVALLFADVAALRTHHAVAFIAVVAVLVVGYVLIARSTSRAL